MKSTGFNPKIPSWIAWPLAIALAHMGSFIMLSMFDDLGVKGDSGDFLYAGLWPLIDALGIIPDHLTDEMQARRTWCLVACMTMYSIAVGFAFYASFQLIRRVRSNASTGTDQP